LKKELRNYIEDAPDITYKSNWDDVSSKIPSKFNDLDREAMVEVFNEYVKKRSEADSSEEEGVINSSSSKSKSEKKGKEKSRSRNHHDDENDHHHKKQKTEK